jgi:zinc protease
MTEPKEVVRTLDNGLRLLLRESHDAPLASFWVWYRVGSRNELPGKTGISHWVEHMQFKGTPSLAKGAVFQSVSRVGGTLNAFTSQDWTTYFMTIPSSELDLALSIESDRMRNSLFDPAETESERTVILSERQGAENHPNYLLSEEVMAAAFHVHPYGHSIIGYEADLRSMTREDLFQHYQTYYHPSNAVVVAIGDFDADELAEQIEQRIGSLNGDHVTVRPVLQEPEQQAERRVIVRKPSPTAYVKMGYKTPDSKHPDTASLLALDAILSGGKPMGLSSGGAMGRSSRLYRSLVATGLARSAGSGIGLNIDPHLFSFSATANPDVTPERLESIIRNELVKMSNEPVGEDELQRALKQVKAQYVYSGEGVTNQAFWIGFMDIVDHHERAKTLVEEIASVTTEDIQRVASTYFKPERSTVGWLVPSGEPGGGSPSEITTSAQRYNLWSIKGAEERNSTGFERHVLDHGLVILSQARPTDPSVAMRIRVGAGSASDPADLPGLAALTGRSLMRGTTTHTFEEINQATDNLGASISVETSRESADVVIRGLIEDLSTLLEFAREILEHPTFPQEEIDKVRQDLVTSIREQEDDTRATADRILREMLFPVGHPYRHRIAGTEESLRKLTREDLIAFHRTLFGPRNTRLAISGGFGNSDAMLRRVESALGGWDVAAEPVLPVTTPAAPEGIERVTRTIAGKSQADIAIGTFGLPRLDARYHAYDIANLILGRLGLMGRLGANVRDMQGLAYYAFSGVSAWETGSIWSAHAGIDPDNAERAIAAVLEEVDRITNEPVSDDEFADAKSYLTGVLPLGLESKNGVNATLLAIEQFDLGLDYIDRYPDIIGAQSKGDLLGAMQSAIDPDRLAIVVVGPE